MEPFPQLSRFGISFRRHGNLRTKIMACLSASRARHLGDVLRRPTHRFATIKTEPSGVGHGYVDF